MRILCLTLVGLSLCSLIALQLGCETKSAESKGLRVEPHAIGLRINQSAEFHATGGFSYTWNLSDPSLGVLTKSDGPVTTYISRFNPAVNSSAVVQHLTVTSRVGSERTEVDSTTGTTNSTTVDSGFTDTAEAIIEHLPRADVPPSSPSSGGGSSGGVAISVSPTSATLSPGSPSRTFVASGGTTYAWSLSSGQGQINTTIGNTVTYSYTMTNTLGSTILTVTSGGQTASATITFASSP